MKYRIYFTLLLLVFSAVLSAAPAKLIINANLLSPERTAVLVNAWVRIDDGRITEVGTGTFNSSGLDVIDVAGAYLIPGLIDSHVHLYNATGLKRRYTQNFDSLYDGYIKQQPRSYLYHGFTSVIELDAKETANSRFESAADHPRLYHCGPGVILSDGYMALELEGASIEKVRPGYLIDNYANGLVPKDADSSKHTPEAVVDYVHQQGGSCIKLYYEEALWWPGGAPKFRLPSVEIVRDVVSAAHARNMPVLLHATTPDGQRFALDAGVDVLVHGMWEWPDQKFDAPIPKSEYANIARDVAISNIGLQPTFNTIRNTASLFDTDLLTDPAWEQVVSEAYLDYLRTDAQQQREKFIAMFGAQFIAMFGAQLGENDTDVDYRAKMTAFNSRYEKLIGGMNKHNANLLFGTDTAVGVFGWGSPPGLAGYWEMQSWVRAGISLKTLFDSLTISNARAFGLDKEIGTIEVGKRADLLVLTGNPLQDVTAYNTIETVILGGDEIKRESLSALE
jgi:imidazolonepropionase-like amidohydrolase